MSETKQVWGFWKIAAIYGGLTGLLIIGFMIGSFSLFGFHSGVSAQTTGFLLMFAILSLIFFGMKKFRDQNQGGVIKFSKALGLGLAMSLCAGLMYVFIWEIYVARTGDNFIVAYTDHLITLEKEKGVSADALRAFTEKMSEMKASYANPLYRMPLTFTEIFPMGFIISLIAALILHTPKLWARKG